MSNASSIPDPYKDTLFLPQTEFAMRGKLPEAEPEILADWWPRDNAGKALDNDAYHDVMRWSQGRPKYLLHWGPPFANGHLHLGHALTYTLKDMVIRAQTMMGHQAPSVTGWDCHGLPIEWKVEQEYRAEGKNKNDVSPAEFRQECRSFAQKWIATQREEMRRLGIFADWDNPYLTMAPRSEARIADEIHKVARKGYLYRGLRPVMWSTVEQTALAEFEIEYKDHKSITVYIGFPVAKASKPELEGANFVIWTTTPWTLPANRMIAVGADIDYGVFEVAAVDTEKHARVEVGARLLIAKDLAETVQAALKITEWSCVALVKGAELEGSVASHPLRSEHDYYGFDVPVLLGDFVTTESGTGLVHCAPGHGSDDFYLGQKHGFEVQETVLDDGRYADDVGLFAGEFVYTDEGKEGTANVSVIKAMAKVGALLGKANLRHQYPHSWRSGAPVIFRTTRQWFIDLDDLGLRKKALEEIKNVTWYPPESENRLSTMVEGRPDWCISRQRVWGVPIALFVHKQSGEILMDEAVLERITDAFAEHTADVWYSWPAEKFLGDDYNPEDYEQVFDIVDVWFESGSTHAFVCEDRDDLTWPADLYLEGSDQHRGWFQASLLQGCATRDQAPYKAVLTHGMTVDEKGHKMSKSLGNGVSPMDLCDQYGADLVRLWAVSGVYFDDIPYSKTVMKGQTDVYRRLRNTLRYLTGNINGLDATERVDVVAEYDRLPMLEKWVLSRAESVNEAVQKAMREHRFFEAIKLIHDFCNLDLSALYFDVRKDRLYCDRPDLWERRACRSVLEVLLGHVSAWLTPILPFTINQLRHALAPAQAEFLGFEKRAQMRLMPKAQPVWQNAEVEATMAKLKKMRRVVTTAIEQERKADRLRSSLEAHPTVVISNPELWQIAQSLAPQAGQSELEHAKLEQEWADFCITSQITLHGADTATEMTDAVTLDDVKGVAVTIAKAAGQKCARSWKILPEVGSVDEFPDLSPRDAEAVQWYRDPARKVA